MLETWTATMWSMEYLFVWGFSKLVHSFPDSSEGEHAEKMDENITDGMDSDNETKSVSKRKGLDDVEGSPTHVEESDEEKPDSGEKPGEGLHSVAPDAQNGVEKKHHSEEKQADGSSEDSGERANNEDKSDSEGNQVTNDVRNTPLTSEKPHTGESSNPSEVGNPEISDDEPLVSVSGYALSV